MNRNAGNLRVDRTIEKRPGSRNPVALDCYLPLVQHLVAMRESQPGGVAVAFTAVGRNEGVTHVVESLGRKLAEQTWEQVLLTTSGDLIGAASARFEDGSQMVPQVQRLVRPQGFHAAPPAMRWDDLQRVRERFGFVLVDCPAIGTTIGRAQSTLNILRSCDGVALVVAAGEARRSEIEDAQAFLQAYSVKLLGVILNKQVDAVPRFISRLF